MVDWVSSVVSGAEGMNDFLGTVAYPLIWIAGGIFVIFTVIAIARRLFSGAF